MIPIRNISKFSLFALLALLGFGPAQARDYMRHQETVHFTTGSGLNFYAGGNVDVTAPARDALIMFGGDVNAEDLAAADVIAAGGKVNLRGVDTGRVLAAGGDVKINGNVKTSLIAAGGAVNVPEGTKIGGDLIAAGGDLKLRANVVGDVMAAGGNIKLGGQVGGNANLRSRSITFEPGTHITGDLTYSSPDELKLADGVVGGVIMREDWRDDGHHFGFHFNVKNVAAAVALATVGALVALSFFALVALAIFSPSIGRAGETLAHEPLQSFGLGALLSIMAPFAIVILFVTVIGIPLALFAIALLAILMALGLITAAYWGGLRLRGLTKHRDVPANFAGRFGWTVVGLIVFVIVGMIPLLGNLIQVLAVVTGLGAIVLGARSGRESNGESAAA